MTFQNFDEIEKAYRSKRTTTKIPAGDFGEFLICEPAAVDFEPVDKRRTDVVKAGVIDPNVEDDHQFVADKDREKSTDKWPKFSYMKLSDDQRAEFYGTCIDMICMSVIDTDFNLIFKGKREFVATWPGGLLSEVASNIIEFVRDEQRGENETGNPTPAASTT